MEGRGGEVPLSNGEGRGNSTLLWRLKSIPDFCFCGTVNGKGGESVPLHFPGSAQSPIWPSLCAAFIKRGLHSTSGYMCRNPAVYSVVGCHHQNKSLFYQWNSTTSHLCGAACLNRDSNAPCPETQQPWVLLGLFHGLWFRDRPDSIHLLLAGRHLRDFNVWSQQFLPACASLLGSKVSKESHASQMLLPVLW